MLRRIPEVLPTLVCASFGLQGPQIEIANGFANELSETGRTERTRYNDGRYYKEGNRDLYNRGRAGAGTPVGGSYTSNDFGRSYKGTPVNGTYIGGRGSQNNAGQGQGGHDSSAWPRVSRLGNRNNGQPALWTAGRGAGSWHSSGA